MITVVNKKSVYWDIGAYVVYIGRPSLLGNPFHVGKDGTRNEVIEKYRVWLRGEYKKRGEVYWELVRLAKLSLTSDIALACWCAPLACHGDVVRIAVENIAERLDKS